MTSNCERFNSVFVHSKCSAWIFDETNTHTHKHARELTHVHNCDVQFQFCVYDHVSALKPVYINSVSLPPFPLFLCVCMCVCVCTLYQMNDGSATIFIWIKWICTRVSNMIYRQLAYATTTQLFFFEIYWNHSPYSIHVGIYVCTIVRIHNMYLKLKFILRF